MFFEKNGFLRPIGLVVIAILLGAGCCTECLFAQGTGSNDQKIVLQLTIPEVVIVETGFTLPPRMVVNPIEQTFNVDQWTAELKYWNRDGYDDLENLLAKRRKVMSEKEKIEGIIGSLDPQEETVTPKWETKRENSILQTTGKSGIQR